MPLDDNPNTYLQFVRDRALQVTHVVMGTIGVLDNLFVIVTFALFIKIADKVSDDFNSYTRTPLQTYTVMAHKNVQLYFGA